jgi:hypothetical protein
MVRDALAQGVPSGIPCLFSFNPDGYHLITWGLKIIITAFLSILSNLNRFMIQI